MENDHKVKRDQRFTTLQTIYNITMGALIFGIGVMMFFNEEIGLDLSANSGLDPLMIYLLSGLFLLYGGFRLYRGIKKDL